MSKLPKAYRFIDLSDYGRPVAKIIAHSLKKTAFTPIHVTFGFIISGVIGIVCIINNYLWAASFFLIFKSILDAADGELARLKKTPSYTGRYFDSIADIILNLFIFLSLWYITDSKILFTILAFLAINEVIKKKAQDVFYDPIIATKEIVDEVYETVNDRNKLIKTLAIAKSAIRHNMSKDLPNIKTPTCIIWGKNDNVTPPEVAEEFKQLLPDSELHWIDKCGHAAMMEQPDEFNKILDTWLQKREF